MMLDFQIHISIIEMLLFRYASMTKNNRDFKSGLYVVIQVGSHALLLFVNNQGGGGG